MNIGALIGLVFGFVILGAAAAIGAADAGVSIGLLADPMSLAIVVGGAMAATAIAFPLPDLIGALGGFAKVFKGADFTAKDIVQDYVNLAEQARKGELGKALDETPEHMPFRLGFIKDGIRMIADGMSKEDIRIPSLIKPSLNGICSGVSSNAFPNSPFRACSARFT
jgi:chemotaxis protein MotA